MTKPDANATHRAPISRLNRADGHPRAVIGVIDEGKPCLDIVQQLQAVEKAVEGDERAPIHVHLGHWPDKTRSPRGPR